MNIWRLIVREIRHRALNFALGFISVSVAIACLIAAMGLLRADEATTRAILTERETAVAEAGVFDVGLLGRGRHHVLEQLVDAVELLGFLG